MSLQKYTEELTKKFKKENQEKFEQFKKGATYIEIPNTWKFSLIKTAKSGAKYISVYNKDWEIILFTTKFGFDITNYNKATNTLGIFLAQTNLAGKTCTYICNNRLSSEVSYLPLNDLKVILNG